jgi:CelD/BcsL family acetyltransferase involved in cellulose biosynthesis
MMPASSQPFARPAGPIAAIAGARNDRPSLPALLLSAHEAAQCPAFCAAWDELSRGAAEPNPFYESWFLRPALRIFDTEAAVSFFTLWDGAPRASKLVGMLPLINQVSYGRWPMAHISNWLHHNAFLGTPLVLPGHAHRFWDQLLAVLDSAKGSQLFLHINGLVTGGPLQQGLLEICAQGNRSSALVNEQHRAFLHGPSTAAEYYANVVRSKKRKELRRQRNRLAEIGDLTFRRHDGGADLDHWTGEFLELERRGWKGTSRSALDCEDDTRILFRESLHGAATRGQLELLDLRLDGAPLAMLVNFICPPGSFSFKTAFDEDYARFSPGVLLQIENLDLLERDGIAWCDSCAAPGHPMIDSLWSGRRTIGRYSVAIGGFARRKAFGLFLKAELMRMRSSGRS